MFLPKVNGEVSLAEFKDFSAVQFQAKLDAKFVCPVCTNPLRDPIQTECGHRLCYECHQTILRNPDPKCPIDKEPLSSGVFRDVCCRREILGLHCYCLNKRNGCSWMKELMYLEEHLTKCQYNEVPCPNVGCGEKVPQNQLPQHVKETCRFKKSECQYCKHLVAEADMETHLEYCPKVPIRCQFCGMENILRQDEKEHVTKHCEEAEKPCQFESFGCKFTGKLEAMAEHYKNQEGEHLKLMADFTSSRNLKEQELKEKMEKIESENSSLQNQLSTHRESLAATTQNLRSYQARLNKVEKAVGDHRRDIAQIRERVEGSASSKTVDTSSDLVYQFDEFRTALAEQEAKLGTLETELQRGSIGASAGPRSLISSSLSLDRRLDRNEHQLALHDIQLAEHDLKIQMLEATSYNGTYIWKIDEFSRRNHEGVIGKTPSIYSPPFYVGRYGYKVCARVYPNGDGMGKGSHLSLFFVIMRGEYDALIPWPFRQKVTFKLLDQDRQQDVSDTFRPDPNSSSFKRPTSNMNIASGCPLFVSQQTLQSRSYVKDDTMFIKITVETTGLASLGF